MRKLSIWFTHTEFYMVPCVNPDGYIYNYLNAPDGGGMWRKNLRDNNFNSAVETTGLMG